MEEKEEGSRENRKAKSWEGTEHMEAFESIPSVINTCLPPLDLSLHESNALVLLTAVFLGLPRCLAHSRCSINNCWMNDSINRGCLVAHYDLRVTLHSEMCMFIAAFHKLT